MKQAVLVLGLVCGLLRADPAEDLLFRARHAEIVQGDLQGAIGLYKQALEDTALDAAHQAGVHLRIATCYERLGNYQEAAHHLLPRMFAAQGVPDRTRRLAADVLRRVEERTPKQAPPPPRPDPAASRAALVRDHMAQARRFQESGNESRALYHVRRALELDPESGEARALRAELESRLSGTFRFVQNALSFLRRWSDARVASVSREADALLKEGLDHAARKHFNLAEGRFAEAIGLLDGCELLKDSDRLQELRQRIAFYWRRTREHYLGPKQADPRIPPATRRSTLVSDYLNHLQRMLSVVSGPDQEFRLLPVRTPRAGPVESGRQVEPAGFELLRDTPSIWTASLFARGYLAARVAPASWAERGNFLDADPGMLVARNRPEVLNALQDELKRVEKPARHTMRARFLLVPASRELLEALEKEFGDFEVSHRGESPAWYRVVPPHRSLDYISSFLIDHGAEVHPARDRFEAILENGAPQTLFASKSVTSLGGVFARPGADREARFGLLLDLYPLLDSTGRVALALRLSARLPVPPPALKERRTAPGFLTQEAELAADMQPGATLIVAGLQDPFLNGPAVGGPLVCLLSIGEAGEEAGKTPVGPGGPLGADISLRKLLLEIWDRPGPRRDPREGFVASRPIEALKARSRFLAGLIRSELDGSNPEVDVEQAVLRVAPALREDAAAIVAKLGRESDRRYVILIESRAVQSSVLERWLERQGAGRQPFGEAAVTYLPAPEGDQALRSLPRIGKGSVFAPDTAWAKLTARGLQARYALSARSRTVPAFESPDDLATGETRTVTEGLRITVRPYAWDGVLHLVLAIETSKLASEVEERALSLAVPSYRTQVTGSSVRGTVDLGPPGKPQTVLISRIPDPDAARRERLGEIVVALTVQPLP